MKKFIITLCALFVCTTIRAQTETINWYKDGELYDTTTCESGGDIDLPLITPTKRGYTFQGWWSYTPIEYLESTGTQYIDTGFVPTKNTKVDFEFAFAVVPNNDGSQAIFGARTHGTWQTSNDQIFVACDNSSNGLYRDSGVSRIYIQSGPIIANMFYKFVLSNSNATETGMLPLYLYALNGNGSVIGFAKIKMKYIKLYDNDVLVRDFIPVIDYQGIPCMFDKVTETFFYNAGTGDFIAGPIVEE